MFQMPSAHGLKHSSLVSCSSIPSLKRLGSIRITFGSGKAKEGDNFKSSGFLVDGFEPSGFLNSPSRRESTHGVPEFVRGCERWQGP